MNAPAKVFLHYLDRLEHVLRRVEGVDSAIGGQRLRPDMFPLLQQAQVAIGFSLRACCPLAGREIVSFGEEETTFASVYRELAATRAYLGAIPVEEFRFPGDAQVSSAAGFADLELSGWDYFLMYTLPNFFFHYSMVYAIARQAGVPIGKADFDGYHQYPQGFAFTG